MLLGYQKQPPLAPAALLMLTVGLPGTATLVVTPTPVVTKLPKSLANETCAPPAGSPLMQRTISLLLEALL